MQMRLDKFLSEAGIGTRSDVKKEIKQNKITVNNQPVQKPEQKINPDTDIICHAGKQIHYEQFSYYLFYKPAGCVTAKTDRDFQTVMDFFPDFQQKGLFPVGRLDKDTEGALLITNDGKLGHRLLSPAYHVSKTYYAVLDCPVPEEAVSIFINGVDIGDEKIALPAKLVILPEEKRENATFYGAELTIYEGRFHQVKRMFLAVGCTVLYLKRLSFGSLTLGNLKKGEYRRLTEKEISSLKKESCVKNSLPQ